MTSGAPRRAGATAGEGARYAVLPPHPRGLRVGLFGGSFNPPHEGHLAVSRIALRRLGLDSVWWLISPGNPLKDKRELEPLAIRLAEAKRLARDPRVKISAIEAALGSPFSFDTVIRLKRRCPGVHFVWIMGADNLSSFHRWKRWREFLRLVPIAVVDRPGSTLKAMASRAGQALAPFRISEDSAKLLPRAEPPAFVFLHGPRSPASSSALRAARQA